MMAVHGVTLVFPSTAYNSEANLQAIQQEKLVYLTLQTRALAFFTCNLLTLLSADQVQRGLRHSDNVHRHGQPGFAQV